MSLTPEEELELAELEAWEASQTKNASPKERTFVEEVAYSPITQGVLGAGDALSNYMSAATASIASPISKLLGGEGYGFQPIKSGSGGAYDVGKFAGEVAPYLAVPETLPARLGASAGFGALTRPNDSITGALEGLAFGSVGEVLPYVGKSFRSIGDKFTRNQYTEEVMASLRNHYESSKAKALKYLNPLLNEYGQQALPAGQISKIEQTFGKNKKNFDTDIETIYEDFAKNPTLENAQALQSQLGSATRGIKGFDQASRRELKALKGTREEILDSMNAFFDNQNPMAKDQYQKFREIYGKETAQYLNNPSLNRIAHGETAGMTPKKLDTVLKKTVQGTRSKVPEQNYIREVQKNLESKLQRSNAYSSAAKGASGIAAGVLGANAFGPTGALLGLAGAKGAEMAKPIFDLLLNEQVAKGLEKIYPSARKAATAKFNAPEAIEIDLIGEY